MRTKLLAVGLLVCCLIVGLGSRFQPENKQWEYHTQDSFTPANANELGLGGWELVTAVPLSNTPYHLRYIYKRPR